MSTTPRLDLVERNLIINGNMDFWQRGTSFTAVNNSSGLAADRFRIQNTLSTNVVASQSADVPTQAQSGFNSVYSLLLTNASSPATVGSGDLIDVQYAVEGQDYQQIHGRRARFQFWVKSSVAGTYSVSFNNNTSTRAYVTTFTVSTVGTWQKVLIDLPLDSTGTWNFDNTTGLRVRIVLATGSASSTSTLNAWQTASGNALAYSSQTNWAATGSATFQIAQVMLIPQDFTQAGTSTVDVPFQRCGRSIGHELQMCQRYYEKSYDQGNNPGAAVSPGSTVFIAAGTNGLYTSFFRTEKRTDPTVTFYSPGTGSSGLFRSESASSDATATLNRVGTTALTMQAASTVADGNQFSYHWTADCEL